MYFRTILFLLATCLFLPLNAYAAVYKCSDKNGKTSYKDKPCAVTQKNQKVKIRQAKKRVSSNAKYDKNKNSFFEAQDRRLNERNQAQNTPSYMALPKTLVSDQSVKLHFKKVNVKQFQQAMESKERSGAVMTDDEKNWRSWDKNKLKIGVKKYQHSISSKGIKETGEIQKRAFENQMRRERSGACEPFCLNN